MTKILKRIAHKLHCLLLLNFFRLQVLLRKLLVLIDEIIFIVRLEFSLFSSIFLQHQNIIDAL